MTRVPRAVSMTSLVMTVRLLIFMTRATWANRRWTSRKLPRVMRPTEATAWASVKSDRSRVRPSLAQCRVRTNASSSSPRRSLPHCDQRRLICSHRAADGCAPTPPATATPTGRRAPGRDRGASRHPPTTEAPRPVGRGRGAAVNRGALLRRSRRPGCCFPPAARLRPGWRPPQGKGPRNPAQGQPEPPHLSLRLTLGRALEHCVLGRPGGMVGRTHLLAPQVELVPGLTSAGGTP